MVNMKEDLKKLTVGALIGGAFLAGVAVSKPEPLGTPVETPIVEEIEAPVVEEIEAPVVEEALPIPTIAF